MELTPYSYNGSLNATSAPYALAYGERVFGAVVVIIISIIGIVGNSMIIISVILSKQLRTSTNAFVVNLGVADLLTCLFLPWFVVALLGQNGWALPNAEWLCRGTAFILYTCVGVSLYNLAAIAINRLVYLVKPFKYHIVYKKRNVAIMIFITWFIPFGFLGSISLAGYGKFGYETVDYPSCSDIDDAPGSGIFNIAQVIVAFPIPVLTIIVCYTWIYVHIRRYFERKREREIHMLKISDGTLTAEQLRGSTENLLDIDMQELQITKYLFVVVCSFFICFLGLFIGTAIPNSGHYNFYSTLPTLANSAINFILYAMMHPQFKGVLRSMMKCRCSEIPQPSIVLKAMTHADVMITVTTADGRHTNTSTPMGTPMGTPLGTPRGTPTTSIQNLSEIA